VTYFDTSALAKWYLSEPSSDEVERYIMGHAPVAISDLTALELRVLLARKRRERRFDARQEMRLFSVFEEDVRRGHLDQRPFDGNVAMAALAVVEEVPERGLRTLDALHLGFARELQAETLATADRTMAEAARELGLEVIRF